MSVISDPVTHDIRRDHTRTPNSPKRLGRWWRFAFMLAFTAVALVPVGIVFFLALRPGARSGNTSSFTFENFSHVFTTGQTLQWLANSLVVTLATVVVSVAVGAPAGYVLSRGRSKAVSAYSLLLFVVQALPVITAVIPLFILFAKLRLVDGLLGLCIIYVGASVSVATWMMAAYMDSIPVALEHAAWIDGCSTFGAFVRIVLRNSLPGILSTAIYTFLVSWNDYLVALVFIRTQGKYTLPVGLSSFFQQNVVDWGQVMALAIIMMAPPVLLFTVLNKYFSIGGIGGSLAGQ
ncbi:carbohydrate ABC transporter permease [Streptomyces violaceusniger]|uniref:carbohydrate ABC transporter permease n=1 Tax=Streptomyces violaceusniger TaxID=68280 RepID=UPI003F5578CE